MNQDARHTATRYDAIPTIMAKNTKLIDELEMTKVFLKDMTQQRDEWAARSRKYMDREWAVKRKLESAKVQITTLGITVTLFLIGNIIMVIAAVLK